MLREKQFIKQVKLEAETEGTVRLGLENNVSIGVPKLEQEYLKNLDRNGNFKVGTCGLMSIIYIANANIVI